MIVGRRAPAPLLLDANRAGAARVDESKNQLLLQLFSWEEMVAVPDSSLITAPVETTGNYRFQRCLGRRRFTEPLLSRGNS